MSAVHTEKWVRTLERSLHMLSDTQRRGCMHGVNQITVSSLIPGHTCMFPLLTPVFSHQLLTPHNSSRLVSPLLQSARSDASVWTYTRQRRGNVWLCSASTTHTKEKKHVGYEFSSFSLFLFFFLSFLLLVSSRHPSPE